MSSKNSPVQDTQAAVPAQAPIPVSQQDPDAALAATVAGQKAATHKVGRTHASATWVATALFTVVLVVLLVFILQNGHSVALKFFSISGHLPLGVALLLAAAAGILLVALPGTARIIQLRRTARRHQHAAETAQTAAGIRVPGQQ